MDNSVTFMVNHQVMDKGIYLAKVDKFLGTATITLDLRVRLPYVDEGMSCGEMHTCEHSFATCVRDEAADDASLKVLYFGPMGCATGFYLLLQFSEDLAEAEYFPRAHSLLKNACRRMEKMTFVPANNRYQCGNYTTLCDIDIALSLSREIEAAVDDAERLGGFHQYNYLTESSLAELLDSES